MHKKILESFILEFSKYKTPYDVVELDNGLSFKIDTIQSIARNKSISLLKKLRLEYIVKSQRVVNIPGSTEILLIKND